MTTTKASLILILVSLFAFAIGSLIDSVTNKYQLTFAENLCIKTKIASGYHRADIIRDNGTCKIKQGA